MRRRDFIKGIAGSATAWPLMGRATDRLPRIGVLMGYPEGDLEAQSYITAFREGLRTLGRTEGRDILIDIRWATPGDVESMQRFVRELVALPPDVILSQTTPTTAALLQQTRTIPIVFALVSDPVGSGFVCELSATWWQRHWFRRFRADASWQVGRTAERDYTARRSAGDAVQSRIGDLCRILA